MFHYDTCGLKNIWLLNGYKIIETPYGKATSISDLEGLHKAIGLHIVYNKNHLSGEEVRFLRKELDLSQAHLAMLLGVKEVSIIGWENSRTKITTPADRLLRLLYSEKVNGNGVITDLIERLSNLNREEYNCRIQLVEETDSGWKQAA